MASSSHRTATFAFAWAMLAAASLHAWRVEATSHLSRQSVDASSEQVPSPNEKRQQCETQRTAALTALNSDPCTITTEKLRDVATEWRRVMIELCGSGEGDVDDVLLNVINPMRRRECQKKVTGQSLAPDVRVYDANDPAPPLVAAALDALFERASQKDALPLEGIVEKERESVALTVRGSRVELADMMRKVKERSGIRYRPSPDQQGDSVEIVCGDRSSRALFQCTGLRVFSAAGTFVPPLSFKNDVFLYTDQFGLRQGVRIATATYAAPALADGFSVKYSAAGIAERTLEVNAAAARRALLLGIEGQQ